MFPCKQMEVNDKYREGWNKIEWEKDKKVIITSSNKEVEQNLQEICNEILEVKDID